MKRGRVDNHELQLSKIRFSISREQKGPRESMFGPEVLLLGCPLDCSNMQKVLSTVVDDMSYRDSGESFLNLEDIRPWITDFWRTVTKFLAENENNRQIFN